MGLDKLLEGKRDEEDYVGPVARVSNDLWNQRWLGSTWSAKDGGYIAIVSTPIVADGLVVIDVDAPNGAVVFLDDGVVGKAATPRGFHYYLMGQPKGALTQAVRDPVYERLSQVRGFYGERLFSPDGKPRALPEILVPSHHMHAHRDAFLQAQFKALSLNIQTPQEEPFGT